MHNYKKQGGVWFTTHVLRDYHVTERSDLGENSEPQKTQAPQSASTIEPAWSR